MRRNAVMLALEFFPSEGGIATLMRSMVTAESGLEWSVLTRRCAGPRREDALPRIVRTAIRPQLRLSDRFWLRLHSRDYAVTKLVARQTTPPLARLARSRRAAFLFADQFCSAPAVAAVARRLNVPWGLWVHGKELLGNRADAPELLGSAALVLASSAFTHGLALAKGVSPQRSLVVNPCVDTERFRPPQDRTGLRKRLRLDGRCVLLTVAHLVERKGHEQVLRAVAGLRADRPDVLYGIVGRGVHEPHLRRVTQELGLHDHVRFLGYVPDEELPDYYAAADIHVMPSTCDGDVEGFGISFIEAAACGTPSIGSRSGGIPDAIIDGKTGFLVEPEDVAGLAEVIKTLLADEDLRNQMGVRARDTAMTCFSGMAFTKALTSAFQQTVLLP
jgi:phosphatidyl-myo-inositol dimannoside synthase